MFSWRCSASLRVALLVAVTLGGVWSMTGCDATTGAIVGGTVGATLVGGYAPASEIEQVYYLGVFDPQEQVPPTIYRITVHGQASAISQMKFASGWVPAPLSDSLGSSMQFDKSTNSVNFAPASAEQTVHLKTGRRMMLLGPEGTREAPADHRLVIVMGSSPEAYFDAISSSLGMIAHARIEQVSSELSRQILEQMLALRDQQDALASVEQATKTPATP